MSSGQLHLFTLTHIYATLTSTGHHERMFNLVIRLNFTIISSLFIFKWPHLLFSHHFVPLIPLSTAYITGQFILFHTSYIVDLMSYKYLFLVNVIMLVYGISGRLMDCLPFSPLALAAFIITKICFLLNYPLPGY